jgi:hypothetical protein
MNRDRIHLAIWDIDPADGDAMFGFADCERLFMEAYEATFTLRATRGRVRPYLWRYLRYGIVAPWVRRYLREQCPGHALAELAEAPLDPFVDWRVPARWLARQGWHLYRLLRPADDGSTFRA